MDIFADFEQFAEQVPLDYLREQLQPLELARSDVAGYVSFNDTHYQRNLLHDGRACRALILCWRDGQHSPIHNHAGSNCFVKVIAGTATELQFAYDDRGLLIPSKIQTVGAGESCVCRDSAIHQLGNCQAGGQDLVTLHVYSPPLQRMELFSLKEPVFTGYEHLFSSVRQ